MARVYGAKKLGALPRDPNSNRTVLERLPPRLRTLLAGFCFREPADCANALAAFLTGVLGNHFVREPKACQYVDANQPGVRKTLLALAIGAVLDGQEPDLIHYATEDEELAKRILSQLQQPFASMCSMRSVIVGTRMRKLTLMARGGWGCGGGRK